ncbi:hypothetical protein PG991_015913 [Apiospora marii]|uniref:Uncharacterized protein n=1 Tax=Apiospora marii TaxID=335849 RepID=A0ABR1R042_9PEZI
MTNCIDYAAAMSSPSAYRPIWAKRKKTEAIARHFFRESAARLMGTTDQIKLWALVQVRISNAVGGGVPVRKRGQESHQVVIGRWYGTIRGPGGGRAGSEMLDGHARCDGGFGPIA